MSEALALAVRLDAASRSLRAWGAADGCTLSAQEVGWFIDRLDEATAYLRAAPNEHDTNNQITMGET